MAGYVYLKENPELLVSKQMLLINSDTVWTDESGRYEHKIRWLIMGGKQIYSEQFPRDVLIRTGSASYSFKSRAKKYSIRKEKYKEIPVKNVDIAIELSSMSPKAHVVEIIP